jgi:hypothetical protein
MTFSSRNLIKHNFNSETPSKTSKETNSSPPANSKNSTKPTTSSNKNPKKHPKPSKAKGTITERTATSFPKTIS